MRRAEEGQGAAVGRQRGGRNRRRRMEVGRMFGRRPLRIVAVAAVRRLARNGRRRSQFDEPAQQPRRTQSTEFRNSGRNIFFFNFKILFDSITFYFLERQIEFADGMQVPRRLGELHAENLLAEASAIPANRRLSHEQVGLCLFKSIDPSSV